MSSRKTNSEFLQMDKFVKKFGICIFMRTCGDKKLKTREKFILANYGQKYQTKIGVEFVLSCLVELSETSINHLLFIAVNEQTLV